MLGLVAANEDHRSNRRERPQSWVKWRLGAKPVPRQGDFLELRYCSSNSFESDDHIPVARVGPPMDHTFPVEWLVDSAAHPEAVEAVRRDLDFYLVDKDEDDPWLYAHYHCGTASNLYSNVQWGHYRIP